MGYIHPPQLPGALVAPVAVHDLAFGPGTLIPVYGNPRDIVTLPWHTGADRIRLALAGIAHELEDLPWSWPANDAAIDEPLFTATLHRLEAREPVDHAARIRDQRARFGSLIG